MARSDIFDYYVGMPEQTEVPEDVKHMMKYSGEDKCENYAGVSFDLNGEEEGATIFFYGSGNCGAASAMPVYIAQQQPDSSYELIFSFLSNSIQVLETKHNGLHDLKSARGTASVYECEIWHFDGIEYIKAEEYLFYGGDEETCLKYPEHCPWDMGQ